MSYVISTDLLLRAHPDPIVRFSFAANRCVENALGMSVVFRFGSICIALKVVSSDAVIQNGQRL